MANLTITNEPLGLRILTENSDTVINEFSIKRNILSLNEIHIISDVKDNYSDIKIIFGNYDQVTFNGLVCADIDELIVYLISIPSYVSSVSLDQKSGSILTVDYAHHEKHEGDDFFVVYSVPSLGAMSSPDDTITLTFNTPDTTKWGHFIFRVTGTGGWLIRLIEAPTGGAETPTGTLPIYNSNRNMAIVSTFTDISGTPGVVSYDATLATGGNILWSEYIAGNSGPQTGGDVGGHDEEIILKQNTLYQLSLFGTDADPATLKIGWYEHTNL